jgi:hypothetical protein
VKNSLVLSSVFLLLIVEGITSDLGINVLAKFDSCFASSFGASDLGDVVLDLFGSSGATNFEISGITEHGSSQDSRSGSGGDSSGEDLGFGEHDERDWRGERVLGCWELCSGESVVVDRPAVYFVLLPELRISGERPSPFIHELWRTPCVDLLRFDGFLTHHHDWCPQINLKLETVQIRCTLQAECVDSQLTDVTRRDFDFFR